MPALTPAELLEPGQQVLDWRSIRQRVADCRALQRERSGKLNCDLGVAELETACQLQAGQRRVLAETMAKLGMSARTAHRVIKVARTVADYAQRSQITTADLLEAVSYRRCQLLQSLLR